MKLKLFKKFFLTTTLMIVLGMMGITVLLSVFVSNYLIDQKKQVLKDNCLAVCNVISELDGSNISEENSLSIIRTMASITEADIFIVNVEGKVLMCSCDEWAVDGLCGHNGSVVSKNIMKKVEKADFNEVGELGGLYSQVQFTYASSLKNSSNALIGAVFSTMTSDSIRSFYNSILKLFLFASLIPIIIMFFVEYFISYRFTKPLKLMSDAARSMAKGDFSKRIPVMSDDEIGELAMSFNQMTNSLVQLEGTRRRFIANISHELKTPMTTIGGFIDGITDGTIPPEKQPYYLSLVSGEIKRLSRMVQSMLSLAKLESGEQKINKTEFDLADMLFNIVVSQEQRIAERLLKIEGLEDIDRTDVNADYDLIYQVVYNLVDNAIKFTNKGGTISFSTAKFDNAVQFKIKNTGEGIEKKDLPFIFERFYKADKARSAVKDSTGLGLHLAYTIISIHGGRISVKSEPSQYTEFTFVLPIS